MPTEKPNILLILADDIGWLDVGAYHRGLMGTRTPNIDRIASEGAMMTDAYAQAVISRAEMSMAGPPPRTGMIRIPGGTSQMGSDPHHPEEAPTHKVTVDVCRADHHTVTNAEFSRIVKKPRCVRPAECAGAGRLPGRHPGDARLRVRGLRAACAAGTDGPLQLVDPCPRSELVPTAGTRQLGEAATGPSRAPGRLGGRGRVRRWMANTWLGEFPPHNTGEDGRTGTAPVSSYPPNGRGVLGMIGSVWEWTTDWYGAHEPAAHACCCIKNPRGLGFRCIRRGDPDEGTGGPR